MTDTEKYAELQAALDGYVVAAPHLAVAAKAASDFLRRLNERSQDPPDSMVAYDAGIVIECFGRRSGKWVYEFSLNGDYDCTLYDSSGRVLQIETVPSKKDHPCE